MELKLILIQFVTPINCEIKVIVLLTDADVLRTTMKCTAVVVAALLCCTGVWCSLKLRQEVSDTFSERATQLLNSIRMPEEDLAAVPQIQHDLELVLCTKWPERQLFRFGSTVNGLAMVGSDMDFIALLNITSTAETVVQQAMAAFQQHPQLFRDIDTFPGSIDFLELHHIPTGIDVDLIFNDFDGVRNTELTNYLVHLDTRVYDLVLIIRYWARLHHITRVRVLSSYAMTLMVVFYLQQRDIIPSIVSLQTNAEPYYINGWNTGFATVKYEPSTEVTLYHLLGGFFEYYNDFDFGKYIISTFTGRPIERKLFRDLGNVPVEYYLYKRNVRQGISRALILKHTRVVIQDPFTHFDNLGKHMHSCQLSEFKTRFQSAVLYYRESKEDVFLDQILDR